jgi:hypothetical protein
MPSHIGTMPFYVYRLPSVPTQPHEPYAPHVPCRLPPTTYRLDIIYFLVGPELQPGM